MCASLVAGPSTPRASRWASGIVSRLGREGCSALCIIPQPTPCRPASACAPWIRASEQVPKPSSSGQAADPPVGAAVHLAEHVLGERQRLVGRLLHAPALAVEVPRPAAEDRAHPDLLDHVGDGGHVEQRAGLAERGGAGADHLDAGELRRRLLLLRRDRGVQRQQPVGQVARHRDVVEHQPAAEVLGQVDVGVDEARHHDAPASVDDAVRRSRRAHRRGGPDLDDVAAVHEHRAVGQDPALAVERQDRRVLDEDHGRSVRRRRSSARTLSVSKASRRSPA